MQPPPRTGPPGASGPPPASVGPNAFRRTRPHKHTGAAVMAGLPAQPMTDPFAFGRQAPPPMATGGHPPPPNSSPLPMQAPPPSMYHQAGMGQGLHQPQPLDSAQAGAVPLGPPPPSTPGVSILTPHGTASPVPFPGQLPGPPGHAPPSAEQGYFNSREPAPSMTPGHLPMASAPMSGQAPYGQDHGGDHHPQAMLFKPVPPVLSQWVPDHGSRPPSVQNYFQPTSDPLPQVCNAAPQSQISPHTPLPHSTPPTHPQQQHQPQPPPQHPDRPTSSQWPDLAGANTPQQHNAHFQAQTYFSQSSATLDSWFNQHPQDLVYHQMGAGPGLARPDSARSHYRHDSAGSHHGSHYGTYHASTPGPAPVPFIPDGTISMFFKGNDVENEETLAGEGAGAVNGLQDFQPSHNHQQMSSPQPQPNPVAGAEATHSYRGPPPQAGQSLTYMNDGNFPGAGKPIQQKPAEAQFDHVENLECVPNQEVLPSEHQNSPAAAAAHGGDCYEAGPNLETPDSVPRPIRSASVSSSYSNLSHGSGTGTVPRRHQGVVGTFIQQESPRPSEDAFSSAAAGGYFEQIDTSPAGNMAAAYQSIPERMCHSQPPTPSPPKPTGIFQASANSSFEPVRSHSVAVRPAEVDRARMVAERGSDSLPGNLEQPPDNLENVYGAATGHTQAGDGAGAPPLAYPLSHSHSRPSSRAHVAHRPCESPATTLWAQHDPASLGTNILLVPAAPPVLAPLREPSAEVIQPPEDGSLDLQPPQCAPPPSQHPSENLENPPKVSEGDTSDSQPNLGYASLLVSESLHQPVLIAPPTSNYSVIPPSNPAFAANQISPREATVPVRPPSQAQGASAAQPGPPLRSNQNPLFTPTPMSFSAASSQSPLNLVRDDREGVKPEITPPPSLSQPARSPLSKVQSMCGNNHSSLPVNLQAPLPAAPGAANYNQLSNYELLDFSMHQSQIPNQAAGLPPLSLQQGPPLASNAPGFYLQVTKDAQQVGRGNEDASTTQIPAEPMSPPVAPNTQQPPSEPPIVPQPGHQGQGDDPAAPLSGAPPPQEQYPPPMQGPATGNAPTPSAAYPGPRGHVPLANPPPPGTGVPLAQPAQPAPTDSQRPPSSLGSQLGYGPPPPGQVYGGYYGGAYPEYPDGRGSYLPAQYPPAPVDPRAQQYYQDDPYMIADPRYGRYEGANPAYPPYREPPPERPSSRTSQYSDRPSSRQGFPPEDYQRANRSAYDDYYAEYYKNQYGDRSRWEGYNASAGTYDPRYRDYYDQNYWYNYNPEAYRGREAAYYNQQPTQQYPAATARPPGYDDKWRYYPGYDASFDDDYRRQKDQYRDDFDRRSVHSEQSAHSLHSSQSHRSRRSSFSSRSQQSEVYRSQPDLTAVYDPAVSTLPVDYSYGQYPEQTDPGQSFSQYPYTSGYQADDSTWVVAEQPPPRPITPEKYSVSHRCARFGPGGQLIQVLPNLPSAGQPALVEIHNMETMLQDTPDQSELRSFPGPLLKEETHKVDVIKFSQNKGLECARNNDLLDKDSAALLWDFIVLLCRQNGTVVGTDIADLLLKEHRSVWLPGKSPNEANLIDFNNEPLARAEEEPGTGPLSLLSDTFMTVPENVGKETERFRELLLFGRKKDALEAAMKGALWGHALLLASKMDSRTHARVMTRFANSLPINDPLQTVYQLMSGRMPASATCCGDEKWGDWRPHLAMVLSNLTHTLDLDTRTITTMGDTLASKGLTDAAHFCYLMAQVGLGVFTKKSTKMVLIGSNHSLSFFQFASNEAIQRTEAYEYAQSLGSQPCSLPNFQVFKLIYACRLAEAGLCAQAFHYCEVISRSVLMQPSYHSPVFTSQLIQMSEKMRFFDPQLKEKADQELFNEPEWLIHLRQLDGQMRTGVIAYNADRDTPQQYDCSTPNSELDQTSPPEPYAQPLDMVGHTSDNPLMTSLMPGPPQQGVQLMPPAPPTILQDGMVSQPPHPNEGVQFYPVPPSLPGPPGQIPLSGFPPQGSGFVQPYQPQQPQPDKNDMFPGAQHQQMAPPQHQQQMMPPPQHQQQMMPPQMQQPQKMPSDDYQLTGPPELQPPPMSTSPQRNTFTPQMDFYDQMAHMGPGRRSRTTSQSSMQMQPPGRRSRTMSESSTHSGGRERSNSAAKQSSPPPPSIPEQAKKDSPKKGGGGGGGGWLNWLYRKGKNEAHLPDDKNKSIVWDEKKQKWVNLDEPEEEYKPPPPPPSGFPKMLGPIPGQGGPGGPPTGGPPVNMFSRRAGTKSRYVDVLNPGGPRAKPGGSAPAPSDFFAPLAPMPMPANLFVPGAEEQQPMEGNVPETGGNQEQSDPNPSAVPQMFNPTLLPPGPVGPPIAAGSPPGEVPLTPQPPPQGAPPSGGVTFYNPAQFAQASTPSGRLLSGRLGGQRAYPVLK
ncbi:protein transport protein Sec16A isoform X1 [Salvelinus sp. IW2-2015]|uniref:protein transport protein Sec16A isoform X1 n=1 Tax=Salvelinus sp. IW2-2015 TaxID=2691554 RepID=UPI000CDFCC47|nr:protein transport protein Sec16A isoform X1 [Salvelinus alpinus]XP_023841644.1 protein transport protein Sec16A isoform X1 [Salvelinus alpinus]